MILKYLILIMSYRIRCLCLEDKYVQNINNMYKLYVLNLVYFD